MFEFFKLKKNPHPRICLLILEREEGGEGEGQGEGERNINQVPPTCTLTGDQTHNLGAHPNQEQNAQPFGVGDDAPAH